MSLTPEFNEFVANWLNKADQIALKELPTYFDKFFTLYVVYNRLYAEATFVLARSGQINIERRTSFPDREGATNYLAKFIGSKNIIRAIENNGEATEALNQVEGLIERNVFSIKLHMVTGGRQRDKDEDLLRRLRSTAQNTKAEAILDLLYSIRCNTFHGHKGFKEVQTAILAPAITLLRVLIALLKAKLANNGIAPKNTDQHTH